MTGEGAGLAALAQTDEGLAVEAGAAAVVVGPMLRQEEGAFAREEAEAASLLVVEGVVEGQEQKQAQE